MIIDIILFILFLLYTYFFGIRLFSIVFGVVLALTIYFSQKNKRK